MRLVVPKLEAPTTSARSSSGGPVALHASAGARRAAAAPRAVHVEPSSFQSFDCPGPRSARIAATIHHGRRELGEHALHAGRGSRLQGAASLISPPASRSRMWCAARPSPEGFRPRGGAADCARACHDRAGLGATSMWVGVGADVHRLGGARCLSPASHTARPGRTLLPASPESLSVSAALRVQSAEVEIGQRRQRTQRRRPPPGRARSSAAWWSRVHGAQHPGLALATSESPSRSRAARLLSVVLGGGAPPTAYLLRRTTPNRAAAPAGSARGALEFQARPHGVAVTTIRDSPTAISSSVFRERSFARRAAPRGDREEIRLISLGHRGVIRASCSGFQPCRDFQVRASEPASPAATPVGCPLDQNPIGFLALVDGRDAGSGDRADLVTVVPASHGEVRVRLRQAHSQRTRPSILVRIVRRCGGQHVGSTFALGARRTTAPSLMISVRVPTMIATRVTASLGGSGSRSGD